MGWLFFWRKNRKANTQYDSNIDRRPKTIFSLATLFRRNNVQGFKIYKENDLSNVDPYAEVESTNEFISLSESATFFDAADNSGIPPPVKPRKQRKKRGIFASVTTSIVRFRSKKPVTTAPRAGQVKDRIAMFNGSKIENTSSSNSAQEAEGENYQNKNHNQFIPAAKFNGNNAPRSPQNAFTQRREQNSSELSPSFTHSQHDTRNGNPPRNNRNSPNLWEKNQQSNSFNRFPGKNQSNDTTLTKFKPQYADPKRKTLEKHAYNPFSPTNNNFISNEDSPKKKFVPPKPENTMYEKSPMAFRPKYSPGSNKFRTPYNYGSSQPRNNNSYTKPTPPTTSPKYSPTNTQKLPNTWKRATSPDFSTKRKTDASFESSLGYRKNAEKPNPFLMKRV